MPRITAQLLGIGPSRRRRGAYYFRDAPRRDKATCSTTDPIFSAPDWDTLVNPVSLTPVPIYGSVGFADQRSYLGEGFNDPWGLCPDVAFCFGPEIEGVPYDVTCGPLVERWSAEIRDDGRIWYGRVYYPFTPIGLDLFPDPLVPEVVNRLGFCFDANGRPVFAVPVNATQFEVRRYVGGVPTTYGPFDGTTPLVFFNGSVQRTNSLWDFVVYYVRAGKVRARYQRDNLAVEYDVVSATDWESLTYVGRGPGIYSSQETLYGFRGGEKVVVKSALYPFWPRCYEDELGATLGALGQGDHELVVIIAPGPPADFLGAVISSLGAGDYELVVVTTTAADSFGAALGALGSGDYEPVVLTSSGADSLGALLGNLGAGDHELIITAGGSYADGTGATLGALGEGDYEPE